jgi:hypothetical protein
VNAKQITLTGGNLFAIAAAQYNDATLWSQIAQANGLVDPVISGTISLTISTGGIRYQ